MQGRATRGRIAAVVAVAMAVGWAGVAEAGTITPDPDSIELEAAPDSAPSEQATGAAGAVKQSPPNAPAPQIVGGTPTSISNFPWQVLSAWNDSIYQGNGYDRRWCGGSLVAPKVVITAAHCVYDVGGVAGWLPASELEVFTGRTTASSSQGQVIDVAEIYHFTSGGVDLYNPVTLTWDVAVMELAGSSTSQTIQIAGPGEEAAWSGGRTAYASGWGDTASGSGTGSNTLLYTPMSIIDDQTCAANHWGTYLIPEVMICAGGGGHDTCQGDSGGPLVVPVEYGASKGYRLVGDTSFGSEVCGAEPGVYGRLVTDPIRAAVQAAVIQISGVNPVGVGARPFEPPTTQITKKPKKVVRTRKRKVRVTFKVAVSEPAGLLCSVDGAAGTLCASPVKFKAKRGKHTLTVQAVDSLGVPDPTPSTVKFKVKRRR